MLKMKELVGLLGGGGGIEADQYVSVHCIGILDCRDEVGCRFNRAKSVCWDGFIDIYHGFYGGILWAQ